MVGQKANAKAKQVGSLSDILKDGNEFLQARWRKCSKFSDALVIRFFFFFCVFVCFQFSQGWSLPSFK